MGKAKTLKEKRELAAELRKRRLSVSLSLGLLMDDKRPLLMGQRGCERV